MQFFVSLWCQTKPGAFFFVLFCFFFFQFDKWTDTQRRRILTSLLERCSLSQQKFCCRKLQEKIPAEALDFTTKLPKVLYLYIFSFLDPRSLCHCVQVQIKKQCLEFCKDSLENTETWGKKKKARIQNQAPTRHSPRFVCTVWIGPSSLCLAVHLVLKGEKK